MPILTMLGPKAPTLLMTCDMASPDVRRLAMSSEDDAAAMLDGLLDAQAQT